MKVFANGYSALLPARIVKCKRCGGQLRGVIQHSRTLIVCDRCEYATEAPPLHKQLMDDLIGQQMISNTRN